MEQFPINGWPDQCNIASAAPADSALKPRADYCIAAVLRSTGETLFPPLFFYFR